MSSLLAIGPRRSTVRRTAGVLGAATVAAGVLLMTQPGSATAASAWSINTFGETICREPTVPTVAGYWLAEVTGTWSSPLSVGLEDVPGVGTIPSGTLAPGSNTNNVNAGGGLNFATPPVGTYTLEAYATDGTTTQTAPITLVVKADC